MAKSFITSTSWNSRLLPSWDEPLKTKHETTCCAQRVGSFIISLLRCVHGPCRFRCTPTHTHTSTWRIYWTHMTQCLCMCASWNMTWSYTLDIVIISVFQRRCDFLFLNQRCSSSLFLVVVWFVSLLLSYHVHPFFSWCICSARPHAENTASTKSWHGWTVLVCWGHGLRYGRGTV